MIKPVGYRVLVHQENYDEKDDVFRSARESGHVLYFVGGAK